MRRGFSLIELSVVLVILGLLMGAVLTGKHFIRSAQLRSAISEFETYQTAIKNFKDMYGALPGGMHNATAIWGTVGDGGNGGVCVAVTAVSTAANIGLGKETCNGNGNGAIQAYHEAFRFWQHLANAELITGKFVGVGSGSGAYGLSVHTDTTIDDNWQLPASGLGKKARWGIFSTTSTVAAFRPVAHSYYGNTYVLDRADLTTGMGSVAYGVMTPKEAEKLDAKIDDGRPGKGFIEAILTTANAANDCVTSNVIATAKYNITKDTLVCGLYFISGY